jgi:hypothetical protein
MGIDLNEAPDEINQQLDSFPVLTPGIIRITGMPQL